jgi:mRNA interferase HigB
VEFWSREPKARAPLMFWYKVAKTARWQSLNDVRRTFGHADVVKVGSGRSTVVFNIAGNNYRLITAIRYDRSTIYILRVLTHAEYSRGKWKEEL